LGFFDKFNFIWFVVALCGATLIVYWKEIRAKLQNVPKWLVAAMALAVIAVGALVTRIVLPLMQPPEINWHWLSSRISIFWMRYEITTSSIALAGEWLRDPPTLPWWPGWAIMAATAGFLFLTLLSSFRPPSWNVRVNFRVLRLSVWCLLMFVAIFVQIVLTPQAGGPHHMLMLFPLDLLACFAAAFAFANVLSFEKRRLPTLLCGLVVVIWVGFQFQGLHSLLRRFRPASYFKGRWSPYVELLVDYLNCNGRQVDTIYCVDCCLGYQLAALCQPDIGRKVRDIWPIFKDWSADKPDAETTVKGIFSPDVKALYVTFTEENTVFAEARRNFSHMNALGGDRAHAVTIVPPAPEALYQIFEGDTGTSDKRLDEK